MRAEVGLLTRYENCLSDERVSKALLCVRNIWIHGQVKNECNDDDGSGDLSDCEDITIDTFGGHTKAVRGFKVRVAYHYLILLMAI